MESKDFLHDFVDIIKNCSYDNTYKMAWAKSLVEIALESNLDELENNHRIDFKEIAEKVLKYYWNHTFFFDLKQGSNPNKPPQVLTKTKELIDAYQATRKKDTNPVRFERAYSSLKKKPFFEKAIRDVVKVLKIDVSHRFLRLRGETLNHIYDYNKGDDFLFIPKENLKTLKDYAFMIFDIINFRWSLILETFNSSPRISKKIKLNDEDKIRRGPLNKYYQYLVMDNPEKRCFICGEPIDGKTEIHHVIPWSYMYSDDIWNLVLTHKSCNLKKSNQTPDENEIKRLQERNQALLKRMEQEGYKNKAFHELQLANENDYVQKFWIGSM
ncbi:MAG: HNH endonuclease domain-containing protein [Bacillota bacterium]